MKIAFFKADTGSFIDKLIKWWTRGGSYSHCEFIFDDGIAFSASGYDGGTRYKKIKFKNSSWDFLEVEVSAGQEQMIRTWCDGLVGKKYDWPGIFGFVWRPFRQATDKWYCSEVIATGLELSVTQVSPNRLYSMLLKTGAYPVKFLKEK